MKNICFLLKTLLLINFLDWGRVGEKSAGAAAVHLWNRRFVSGWFLSTSGICLCFSPIPFSRNTPWENILRHFFKTKNKWREEKHKPLCCKALSELCYWSKSIWDLGKQGRHAASCTPWHWASPQHPRVSQAQQLLSSTSPEETATGECAVFVCFSELISLPCFPTHGLWFCLVTGCFMGAVSSGAASQRRLGMSH